MRNKIPAVAAVLLSVAVMPMSNAFGASAASVTKNEDVKVALRSAPANSGSGWIIFSDIYQSVVCTGGKSSVNNLGTCRNQDKGISNALSDPIRIYYSINHNGAWACLPAQTVYQNLNHSNQTFNNGSGDAGYGQQVWENVASLSVFEGSCSNPMPGGQH